MKVFLSHSSKDKGFVEGVAKILRPGSYELDSLTFDKGLLNSSEIIKALRRCDLFCLFLSKDSAESKYVDFETLLGVEHFAGGAIKRILVICMDDDAFSLATKNIRYFNMIRKQPGVEGTARLIQGSLIAAQESMSSWSHPFIGRDKELGKLTDLASDITKPAPKGLFISGNIGSGRKSISQQFFQNYYPHVGKVFPKIYIEQFAGLDELYRKVLSELRPSISVREFRVNIQSFGIASKDEKVRLIADQFNSLLTINESVQIIDVGGLLSDNGSLVEEFDTLISKLDDTPHPAVIIITNRMTPFGKRRPEEDLLYLALQSFGRDDTNKIISRLLKEKRVKITSDQLSHLIDLSDGHAFNIYRMAGEIIERGIEPFLANPKDFIDWKHQQSTEYIHNIEMTPEDVQILSILGLIPELDFASIVTSLELDSETASKSLQLLSDLHIVQMVGDRFTISPALQVAVQRDHRIRFSSESKYSVMKTLASNLSIRLEDGSAPVTLIDAAVLSSLESGEELSAFTAGFILPSHQVKMAKRNYDGKNWLESIRFAKEAIRGANRLSQSGYVSACRILCLAATRLSDTQVFDFGILKLKSIPQNDYIKSNITFLKGFLARLSGNFSDAETYFRESYSLVPGNRSAARELASVCLALGKLENAETFAREALAHANLNPFILDVLISILVKQRGRSAFNDNEITELLETLKELNAEDGRSFFATRKAELEHLWGDNRKALTLVKQAIKKTPRVFEPRQLEARIYIKDKNFTEAHKSIKELERMSRKRASDDRKTNYRAYLETFAEYLTETRRFDDAKKIYSNTSVFTSQDRKKAIRDIEIVEGYLKR